MVEHTADGRHVVIDGRRWRATDPNIPERLRTELVAELMAARRAVRDRAVGARARVNDAKIALGERGEPWWEQASAEGRAERLVATVQALLHHRAADSTICPSDAARVVGGSNWRAVVPTAREVVAQLCSNGTVRVTQGGKSVDPLAARGPIRIGRGPSWPAD